MAHSTISALGVGATQAGTAVTTAANTKQVIFANETNSDITLDLKTDGSVTTGDTGILVKANSFLTYDHIGAHGACVMENVKSGHGTAAIAGQEHSNYEATGLANRKDRIYIMHRV
tara:strand:- start:526 stop:873 length:348 start_codon:yes stop_codon:yes gene_type:complete